MMRSAPRNEAIPTQRAARENWLCLFYHEPDSALGRVVEEGGKLRAVAHAEAR